MIEPLKIAGWHFPSATLPFGQVPLQGPLQEVPFPQAFGPGVGVGGCVPQATQVLLAH